jgi:WD40 repeat protein
VSHVVFSPDGANLATAGGGSVRVWAAGSGQQLAQFVSEPATALAFSPSGRVLAVGRLGPVPFLEARRTFKIHVHEIASGQEIRRIDAPQGWIFSLAFRPDGRVLASGGGDSTILLWDLTGSAGAGKGRPPR